MVVQALGQVFPVSNLFPNAPHGVTPYFELFKTYLKFISFFVPIDPYALSINVSKGVRFYSSFSYFILIPRFLGFSVSYFGIC